MRRENCANIVSLPAGLGPAPASCLPRVAARGYWTVMRPDYTTGWLYRFMAMCVMLLA
jgi:hypothetical protein